MLSEKYRITESIKLSFPQNQNLEEQIGFGFKGLSEFQELNLQLPYYAGLLVLSGQGSYEDENGYSCSIGPGSFVQRFPGLKHKSTILKSKNPETIWQECYFVLGYKTYENFEGLGIINRKKPVLNPGIQNGLIEEGFNIMQSLKNVVDYEMPLSAYLKIHEFLFNIVKLDRYEPKVKNVKIVNEAMILLGKKLNVRNSTEDILKSLNMNYNKLRNLFKSNTGLTPGQYRIIIRINKACSMLNETNKSLVEIAEKLGYPDVFIFSKQFKNYKNLPPLKYRKLGKAESVN
jgi:AraC family transcriptional regulator, arabinose operon regulatory protein